MQNLMPEGLTQAQRDRIGRVGEKLRSACAELRAPQGDYEVSPRWAAIAVTEIEKGMLAAIVAIQAAQFSKETT